MKRKTFIHALLVCMSLGAAPTIAHAQNISTVAGCGLGDDSIATRAELLGPVAIAVDTAGNTYISDVRSYRIRKVSAATGVITTIAGSGALGNTGDGGPATAATFGTIYGITVDRAGNVYIVDNSYGCVRKITAATGIITTIAGTGAVGFSGDGGPATSATFNNPIDIAVDTFNNLYITDWYNNRVRKITAATGIISTVVGDGLTFGGTGSGGLATASQLGAPFRVTIDRMGNLYVAEVQYQCICKVDTAGIITIIADSTGAYAIGVDGDGGSALLASMTSPCGLAVDTFNNLYFSDIGNARIRKVNMNTGIMTAFAASGIAGFSGDAGLAVTAQISEPEGLATDKAGNLLICDPDNNRIRKVSTLGIMSTFAGQSALFGEGLAINDEMSVLANMATDAAGNVYVADNYNNRVRKIDVATGAMTTVVGSGISGYNYSFSGDGGPATLANIANPQGVAIDDSGNIYVADQVNNRIRKVEAATGIITTFAGNGTAVFGGDGGLAINAKLNAPSGVAVDTAGNVYIADQGNNRIRKVNHLGVISTLAGGSSGFSGDGGPATAAKLYFPADLAVDDSGNLYIADEGNNCVRKINTAGVISSVTLHTTAGGDSGDGGLATAAELSAPTSIKVNHSGTLFIADGDNNRIRMIRANGTISTVAGTGAAGYSGDGGTATAAMLNGPSGVALDNSGNMYIADASNFRVRKVDVAYLSVPAAPVAGDIQVYPNPAHDMLTITANAAISNNDQVAILNTAGQEVYHASLILSKQTINISGLASGVYMVQVSGNKGIQKTVKIVKE